MALFPIASIADNAAVLSFDVVGDMVVGVHLSNNFGVPMLVNVTRPNGAVWQLTAPLGESSLSLPRGRQFSFSSDAADWQMTITPKWP